MESPRSSNEAVADSRAKKESMYDVEEIRKQFPILQREVYGKPLVYLDNGATTQKPLCVLNAMQEEYLNVNANVHRGVHYLSQQATELHEGARETVRRFINARSTSEIVFTRGTTEALNLVAASFVDEMMQPGDEVIVSTMEHHSNIVPWQLQAAKKGIAVRVIPMHDDGTLDMEAYVQLFNERTRLVSVCHVSNVLGTVNPVEELVRIAHENDVPVMIDGAQSAPHRHVDVQQMDCDFFAFSGHKMYGPTGVGVLYGKEEWLFQSLPFKFEAGTPDYIATTGLAKAIDFLDEIGINCIHEHESELLKYCQERLQEIEDVRIFGQAKEKDAVVSFLVGDIHHLDMGTLLDRLGIAVRTGHHCAQPLMERLGISGTVRASFALYNTKAEIDVFIEAMKRVVGMF